MNHHVRGRGGFAPGHTAEVIRIGPDATEAVLRAAEYINDAMRRLDAIIAQVCCLQTITTPPPNWTLADNASLRRHLDAGIDALIFFVDQLDGDADLEPTAGISGSDDECEDLHDAEVVTWPANGPDQLRCAWHANDDDEPDADAELTWPETAGRGPSCLPGGTDDDEEGGDREPDVDDEPDDEGGPSAPETGCGSQL